jgi:AcrR family transcriptional regulator
MSPRPAARPDDPEGIEFLTAAARLIDKHLSGHDQLVGGDNWRFPALDWLRLADVARAAGRDTNAIYRRWRDRDAFLRDAVGFTLRYADVPEQDWHPLAEQLRSRATARPTFSAEVAEIAGSVLDRLAGSPRSYLRMHMAPLLGGVADLREAALTSDDEANRIWAEAFRTIKEALGLRLRPGVGEAQVAISVQAMLDGFLLRGRLHEADAESRAMFIECVYAYLLGVLDHDESGLPADAALDAVGQAASHRRDHDRADPGRDT